MNISENFRLNKGKRELCAVLLAEGDKLASEIAQVCGITDRTLRNWQHDPEFAARVAEIKAANAEKLQGEGLRRKDNRLALLQGIVDRIQAIIDGRATEMDGECAGGKSGLLARSYDKLGNAVYKFDAALVRELRETMKQAAIELGQWTEKQEVNLGEVKVIHVPAKLSQEDWSAQEWEQPE